MPPEPNWIWILAFLAAGFVCLAKGADWLVGGGTQIAVRFGVSTLVIGMTIVAFGTSAPEIVVSAAAAVQGKADISLGNVLGSNVANIGLVLGACAIVLPRVMEARLAARELFWLFASLGAVWWAMWDRAVTRPEGAVLLLVFTIYNLHLMRTMGSGAPASEPEETTRYPLLNVLIGIASIAIGAKLVVDGAEAGALRLGIPASVVGLTVVSIGTSLPELAAGLGGALRGESDISLGNVVGSNVFNLLAVIGIVAVIQPMVPDTFEGDAALELSGAFDKALSEDVWVVLAFSLGAVLLPILTRGGGRWKGALLLLAYAAYCLWLYASRAVA